MDAQNIEIHTRVVGVTHVPGYPHETLYPIRDAMDQTFPGYRSKRLAAVIVPNPQTVYDANAREVHVPAIDKMIGHLPRQIAERIRSFEYLGYAVTQAEITGVRVHPDNPDNPGVDVIVKMRREEQ